MNRDHEFSVGDVVLDSHQESPDPAVVVNLPPRRADEWTVFADTTVAEDNPDYPSQSPVIIVAFYDDLSERATELLWPVSPIPLTELHDYDVKDYAFPPDRLERADDTSLPARHSGDGQETTTEADDEAETINDADERDDRDNTPEDSEESSTKEDGDEHDLDELRDYLKDNGVRSEIDDETVVVEKLGETYRLSTDEVVEGDGAYQDRLEQLLDEAPV